MAIDILYDNGLPAGLPGGAIAGSGGALLAYSETNGVVSIAYEAEQPPTFTPTAGDVAVIFNTADLTDFGVFYVTGPGGQGEPVTGDYPISIGGTIDKNFYAFSKVYGESYKVQIYSTDLYSDLTVDFANTFKVSTQTEKSHYSDLMIAYSKKISHTVILDNLRRNFWSSKDALMADTIFLIDSCTNGSPKAYKVSIDDATFEVFNNKFKSTVSFNLASSKL
jgi:hypothetical protein